MVRAMPKKARKKRPLASGVCYEGPLAEPIYGSASGGWIGSVTGRGAEPEDLLRGERMLKLPALLKLYGIDEHSPNAWADLAWALACDHVPGMQAINQVSRKRGRKPTWKSGLGRELLDEVYALREKKKIGIKEALKELRGDKTKVWKKHPIDSLGPRYREAARAEKVQLKTLSATIAFLDMVSGKLSQDDLREKFEDMKISQRRN
jgi:hypothetical protein